ncbi:MAG: SPW repeat protein [Gammaproteobacteria bacterium]|nr:SPW repeat protein [Gammaproteobacteria bacterium]NIR86020.1 SPW repeat protein [Gammaproteobacteria bacterium]NIR92089.1 SPW repeat protein [Gammaproteobacteria bacterium]
MERQARWQDWVSLVFAIWLFLSPFIFEYRDVGAAAWNAYVFGVVIAIMSIVALVERRIWEEWIDLIVGIWLVIAPFVLGFTTEPAAMWNHVILGVLLVIDTIWAMGQTGARRPA